MCISVKRHEEMSRAKSIPGSLKLHTINTSKPGGMFFFSEQKRRPSTLLVLILLPRFSIQLQDKEGRISKLNKSNNSILTFIMHKLFYYLQDLLPILKMARRTLKAALTCAFLGHDITLLI